jgi:Lipase maturation factor
LFVLYLSYFYAGQDFMSFQWDLLLLEAGFLAIFLTGRSRIVVWLYRWLLFRYLFLAGAVKLLSGDPTWRDWTALTYHFWTQPLPTPLAWYAAQLPHWMLVAATAAALAVELVLVFLIFLPRRLRFVAACSVLLFQMLILLTGNYNFFNLLSMLLCIFLFDDAALRRVMPEWLAAWVRNRALRPGRAATIIATVLALVVVPVGLNRIWQRFTGADLPVAGALTEVVAPLLVVNPYGLFAVMTTARPEIVIEGSADGHTWREYVFRYKPGPMLRAPSWNIPHQPRLDWQMWFAALGTFSQNRWFGSLMLRLLEGSPPVLALLDLNPFPDHPPEYVRARLYDYRFADPSVHAETGQWWVRRDEGFYFAQVSLAELGRARPGP